MASTNPQSSQDPSMPGLPESIRLMLASAAGYFHARFALLSLEAKDAGANYVKLAIVLVCLVLFLLTGLLFLMMAGVYAVAALFSFRWGWVFLGFRRCCRWASPPGWRSWPRRVSRPPVSPPRLQNLKRTRNG